MIDCGTARSGPFAKASCNGGSLRRFGLRNSSQSFFFCSDFASVQCMVADAASSTSMDPRESTREAVELSKLADSKDSGASKKDSGGMRMLTQYSLKCLQHLHW